MKIVVDGKYQYLAPFIARLPHLLDEGRGELVYDGRNQVARFREQGLVMMVKRFKRVNFIQQIVYSFFRKTKAERAYSHKALAGRLLNLAHFKAAPTLLNFK